MRKNFKKIFASALVILVLLSFMSVKTSAKTVTQAVNGGTATLICAVNVSGARAETQCRAANSKVSVSATYRYRDENGNIQEATSTVKDVTLTAQVLFKLPLNCRSNSVQSKHTVVIGGKTTEWTLGDRMGDLDGGPDC